MGLQIAWKFREASARKSSAVKNTKYRIFVYLSGETDDLGFQIGGPFNLVVLLHIFGPS